jgi:hypothetical protein
MYDEKLKTELKEKPKLYKTCTFYCRGVEVRNRNFAKAEAKRLRFATMGKYIDALLEWRRTEHERGNTQITECTND